MEPVEETQQIPAVPKKQTKQIVTKQQNKQSLNNEIKAKQNIYFTNLKKRIDKYKSYPKKAVRRGIQGSVKVNFTLSCNGELISYKIIEGKKIFKKSVIKAIKNSFPFKPPTGIFTKDISFTLTIKYSLYS